MVDIKGCLPASGLDCVLDVSGGVATQLTAYTQNKVESMLTDYEDTPMEILRNIVYSY